MDPKTGSLKLVSFVTYWLFLFHIQVVVDYEGNPNANTGLFMMVVPEKLNGTADRPIADDKQKDETPFLSTSVYHHNDQTSIDFRRLWMKNVNDKLSAVKFRINNREPTNKYYMCNNRDVMLKTTTVSSDVNSMK